MTSPTTDAEGPTQAGKGPKDAKSKRREGRAPVSEGMLLTARQIALLGKIDRGTLSEYLQMPGAPKADDKGRRHFGEVMRFVGRNQRKGGGSESVTKMREALLQIELEKNQLELEALRGRLIDKKEIEPAITAACAAFVAAIQRVHEGEMPPKLVGKTAIEIREMLAAGNDRIVKELNEGLAPLTK